MCKDREGNEIGMKKAAWKMSNSLMISKSEDALTNGCIDRRSNTGNTVIRKEL